MDHSRLSFEHLTQVPDKDAYVIASAYRTLQVLRAFAIAPHRFGLAELSKRMGIEKNQLYRSLKTLEQAGFLKADDNGVFSLSALIHTLGAASVRGPRQSVVDAAQPYLDALVAESGESVNLFVRVEDFAVCVDRRDSPQLVRLASVLGQSVTLHAGAVPKAILAFLAAEERERVLVRLGEMRAYTAKTVLEPTTLRTELALIRARGYSVSDEDYDASARGVGAPIFAEDGEVIGGMSVGGPSFRVDDAALATFAELITRTTRSLSRRLGYGA